jgi:hypothetical protein
MSIPCCATPDQTLTSAFLIAAAAIAAISGLGLLAAALGIGGNSGWRSRWGIWLPSVFGVSLAVGAISFVLLLASGIH